MEFILSLPYYYLHIATVLVYLFGYYFLEVKKDVKMFLTYQYVFYTISLSIFMISIPSSAVLGSFGYPYDVSNIENKKFLLKSLQESNDIIVKTNHALRYLVLITLIFPISIFHILIKNIKIENPHK
jgi:hypothetical protein